MSLRLFVGRNGGGVRFALDFNRSSMYMAKILNSDSCENFVLTDCVSYVESRTKFSARV